MPEVRPIPDAPGYFATDDGRILSTWRRSRHGQRIVFTPDCEPKELSLYDRRTSKLKPTPYRSVMIARIVDGARVRKPAYVHHLVALTFLGPRPEGAEVLHGPEGSSCNAARNLRYGSVDENAEERNHCRGDAWYEARGLVAQEYEHAFEGLL